MSCYGRSKHANKTQKVCCIVKIFPLTPVKTTYHIQVVSEVFSSFLPHVFFLHLVILRKRKVEFLRPFSNCSIHGRASLAMEGKSVLPMHKAILVYRRKYTLKYPNGLITCVCRHWLEADGFQLHTEQYLSSDIVLSPLQDLLTKRGHVRLTVWL